VTAIAGAVRGEAQYDSVDVKYAGSQWNKEVRRQNWPMYDIVVKMSSNFRGRMLSKKTEACQDRMGRKHQHTN
jgi:hypothetical protein